MRNARSPRSLAEAVPQSAPQSPLPVTLKEEPIRTRELPVLSYLHVSGRTLIMGDLHGCYQQLLARLSQLHFSPEQGDCLIGLGDLTDRGQDNLASLRLLHQPWFHTIRGNHEQLMLMALLGNSRQARQLWFCNGGCWFDQLSEIEQAEVRALCLERIRYLPYALEISTRQHYRVGVVHADPLFAHWQQLVTSLRAPSPAAEVLEKLLWRRERFTQLRHASMTNTDALDRIKGIDLVCLGHTPLSGEAPWARGNLLWLDNGCFAGYPLIVLDIEQWLDQHPPIRERREHR